MHPITLYLFIADHLNNKVRKITLRLPTNFENEAKAEMIFVYPDPTSGDFNITFSNMILQVY